MIYLYNKNGEINMNTNEQNRKIVKDLIVDAVD